jgi:hypothetical protein
MSYFLATENGYADEFGSAHATCAFDAWAGAEHGAELAKFCKEGFSEDPQALAHDLATHAPAPTDNVEALRQVLLAVASKAEKIVILTDGVGGGE